MSGVSLNPAAFVAGGGLLDNADVIIKSARFAPWDYNGAIQTPVLAAAITYQNREDDSVTIQYYSAGDMKNFVPSEDGRQAIPVGKAEGLNESSNFYAFLTSLVNSGFPVDKITNDISVFDGLECHVDRVPQPKRKGMAAAADNSNKTILIVSKITKYPWDSAASSAPAAAPKAVGKVTPATPTANQGQGSGAVGAGSPVEAKADETVMGILMAKGGECAKPVLAQEVFKVLAKDPDRNTIVQMAYKDEYLGAPGKPWAFDGTTVKLG